MSIAELSRISRAQDIAMSVHANQFRKVSKKPYFLHPFCVYQAAKEHGYSDEVQIISILHDVLENTTNKKYVEEKIKSTFGGTILEFVKLLSHNPGDNYNKYLLFLAKKSKTALTVKLLDIEQNLKDNPSEKQMNKYINGIKYLLKNNIEIDKRFLDEFRKYL